ncbi:MAG: SGNH/GDSL hydrolase family protein [Bacteroidota bacterium]
MKKEVQGSQAGYQTGAYMAAFLLRSVLACLIALMNLSCKKQVQEKPATVVAPQTQVKAINYLALGDSYTIGESVAASERFPLQLSSRLNAGKNYLVKETRIVARTGWTTQDLTNELDRLDIKDTFTLVSLLIGVNNQYQGRDTGEYATQFTALLNRAVSLAGHDKRHVFVVSIPDYGYTPFGESDRERISQQVDNFNAINKRITDSFGIRYIDITPISRNTGEELTAGDGLHPSAKQYGLWVDKMEPLIKNLLVE